MWTKDKLIFNTNKFEEEELSNFVCGFKNDVAEILIIKNSIYYSRYIGFKYRAEINCVFFGTVYGNNVLQMILIIIERLRFHNKEVIILKNKNLKTDLKISNLVDLEKEIIKGIYNKDVMEAFDVEN